MARNHLLDITEREYTFTVKSPEWLKWIDPFTFVPMMIGLKIKYFIKKHRGY